MNYQEFIPAEALRSFIKCYYIFEPDKQVSFLDKAYATGCVEAMFNLGNGTWQVDYGDGFITNPSIELWGQIIQPLTFQSIGKNFMLGVRFYPHAAALFLNENVSHFNNRITNLGDVSGKPIQELYEQLKDKELLSQRISLLNKYFLRKLIAFEKKLSRPALVSNAMNEMKQPGFFDNIDNLANRYGITARYLQKIFVQQTGLTPKLYGKINRFQNSLQLIAKQRYSLTDIAYECGYFDQSHFIREFKSFTGKTPSAFDASNTSAVLASPLTK